MASGLGTVTRNLNLQIARIEARTIEGLMIAGRIIEEDARDMVPVLTGKLKASSFTRRSRKDPKAVEVGFGVPYAPAINFDDDMKLKGQPRPEGGGRYWGPAGTAGFLEKSIQKNAGRVLKAVKDHVSK